MCFFGIKYLENFGIAILSSTVSTYDHVFDTMTGGINVPIFIENTHALKLMGSSLSFMVDLVQ